MDKIIENSICSCCNEDTNILKVVAGNDINVSIQLSVKENDEYVIYELDDIDEMLMNVVSPTGDKYEVPCFIASNKISGIIDSNVLESNVPYGIELIWKDGQYDKRAYADDVIMFVNSSIEATDSAYRYDPESPYEYNIIMENDTCYISIGQIPDVDISDYVTNSQLTTSLDALWQDCNDTFVDHEELADAISDIDLSDYVTQVSLSSNSYVTQSSLDAMSYVENSHLYDNIYTKQQVDDAIAHVTVDLSDYYTKEDIERMGYVSSSKLDTILDNASYVTTDGLNLTLSDYVTSNDLTTTLSDYVTTVELDQILDDCSYITYAYLYSYVGDALSDITVDIDTSAYVKYTDLDEMSYATHDELDNYNNAIAVALVEQELAIRANHDNFSNFYDKTASDTRYITASQVATNYVDFSSLNNATYTTSAALNELNDRVDVLENSDFLTQEDIDEMSYVTQSDLDDAAYITLNDLPTIPTVNDGTLTIQRNSTSVGTFTANQSSAATINISVPTDTLDLTNSAGFITLNDIPSIPNNVVTSDDGDEIVCLTQSEYDTLDQGGNLDPDVFYYITDATSNYVSQSDLTNYVTQTQLNTAISRVTIDESNLVHKTGSETITGVKTFSGNMVFDGETTFKYSSPARLNYMDIANPIYKSSMMARPAINQIITCEIIAGNVNETDSFTGFNNEANAIKFEKITGTFNNHHPLLTQLAKIDSNGIYEGNTLLSNKYAQISSVPTATSDLTNDSGFVSSSSVTTIWSGSQADYNLLTPDSNTLYIII